MSGEERNILRSELPELDVREVFFVRHAARIRSWAALERDVHARAEELLQGLAEDLERIGCVPGIAESGVRLRMWLSGGWPTVALCRVTWPPGQIEVCLQWSEQRVSLVGPDVPYVGVRLEGEWYGAAEKRDAITESLSAHRALLEGQRSRRWPTSRPVPLPNGLIHDDWIDLDGYRDLLIAELVAEWHAVADTLDRAVAGIVGG